ncbi:MAG TPA: CorA family divalent cation transporter [Candidatus Limnocylindrales bacterium]|nr:CorA family divalent cation transporter [Candidatus Limnocylindrales bacterium]
MSIDPKSGIRTRLFDADRPDDLLSTESVFSTRPTDRQLLWIDATGEVDAETTRRLAEQLELRPRTAQDLQRTDHEPSVALHRDYLHVRIAAEPNDDDPADVAWLDLIAAPNVVISQHDRPIAFLDDVDRRIKADSASGILSSVAFLTVLVDAAITSYHGAVDAIEEDVDRLDAQSLRADGRSDLLGDLVRCRRRIARLRQLMADHRVVFTALAAPDVGRLVDDPDATSMLQGLSSRYEGALAAVEASREAVLGSFDVFMSRTAQRTNEVMKVLTLATVLLLPGSMIAGLLGMNVVVPLSKDDPMSFWFVVIAIVVLALVIVLAARARRWL